MRTRLQELRRERGYKSAKSFAEEIGMSVGTYTQYEQGQIGLSLEKAWEFADVLNCSLDELAGRNFDRNRYLDPKQKQLNHCYESMNDGGKNLLVETAESISADPRRRIERTGEKDNSDSSNLEAV